LLDGQYESPVRIVAFNTGRRLVPGRDRGIADELRRRYAEDDDVAESFLAFMEAHRR
jgi:hypothetical protein